MQLVVNASPLILLAACDQLELLDALASEVIVPAPVLQELEAGAGRDRAAEQVRACRWITLGTQRPLAASVLSWDLGPGETAVLSWAAEQPGFTALVDDRAARNCARALALPAVGTLGVVLAAKKAGLLPLARPLVRTLLQAGYYLAEDVLERALRDVGEPPGG